MQKTTLILGASGCVGRALRATWPEGQPALWQTRAQSQVEGDLTWDILSEPAPQLPPLAGVIVLAGTAAGVDLSVNTKIAHVAARFDVPVLLASTQAVYGTPAAVVTEATTPDPTTPYGQAKLDMEHAVTGVRNVCCLRLANVVGCDGLGRAIARMDPATSMTLDQFPSGEGPRRMMIRPEILGHVLRSLLVQSDRLPRVVNVAEPGLVRMQDVLTAQGRAWHWREAPTEALECLEMNVSLLCDLVPGLTGWKI